LLGRFNAAKLFQKYSDMRFFVFLFLLAFASRPNSEEFEGVIRYKLKSFDQNGKLIVPVVEIQDTYYASSKKITKVVKGDFKFIVGDYYMVVDVQDKKMFEVWPHEDKIVQVKDYPESPAYTITKEKATAKILGIDCSLYKVTRVLKSDTTFIEVYAASAYKVPNISRIVDTQGQMSLENLNGSINGVFLRITSRNKTSHVEMEAVKVTHGKVLADESDFYKTIRVVAE
jgi:hypothetical protein